MLSLLTGRVGLIAAGVLVVLAVVATIYWMGGREARREAGELRDQISTHERMRDADPDFADCGWSDRLFNRCE